MKEFKLILNVIIISSIIFCKTVRKENYIKYYEEENSKNLTINDMSDSYKKLEDVMEITELDMLKEKMEKYSKKKSGEEEYIFEFKKAIVYHEVSLNLFKEGYKGYAKKSYEILSHPDFYKKTPDKYKPYIMTYTASARSLMGSEEGSIGMVKDAFYIYDITIKKYGEICYAPYFFRASLAENLPWIFFAGGIAKNDFIKIIELHKKDNNYADDKIMSFVYFGLGKIYKSDKEKSIQYLDKAIEFDKKGDGAGKIALALKNEIYKK